MYENIQLSVPGPVVKQLMHFLYPHDRDTIDKLNYDTTQSSGLLHGFSELRNGKTLNDYPVLPQIIKTTKHYNILKKQEHGFLIHRAFIKHTLMATRGDEENYFLQASFDVQRDALSWMISVKGSDLLLNLDEKIWHCGKYGGPIIIRDNNLPLEIQSEGDYFHLWHGPGVFRTKEQMVKLFTIAVLLSPTFKTGLVDYDVIEEARQFSLNNGLITVDDLDYIDSETKFILSGVENEFNY